MSEIWGSRENKMFEHSVGFQNVSSCQRVLQCAFGENSLHYLGERALLLWENFLNWWWSKGEVTGIWIALTFRGYNMYWWKGFLEVSWSWEMHRHLQFCICWEKHWHYDSLKRWGNLKLVVRSRCWWEVE